MILGNKIIKKSGGGPSPIRVDSISSSTNTNYPLPEDDARSHSIIVVHDNTGEYGNEQAHYLYVSFSGNELRLVSFSWGSALYPIMTIVDGRSVPNQQHWAGEASRFQSDFGDGSHALNHGFSFFENRCGYKFRGTLSNSYSATAVLQDENGNQYTIQLLKS